MRHLPFFVFSLFLLGSCQSEEKTDLEALKAEIRAAEKAFNDMAAESGVKEAFLSFSAEDAVLNRGGQMIKGRSAIGEYFDAQPFDSVRLQWTPEFVDVSTSGDLAYTYGPFTFSAVDSTGQTLGSQGFFHTVWKKQADGSWKFVYD